MIADYGDGGQKMFDIMTITKSLKVTWIVNYILKIVNSNGKIWGKFYLSSLEGEGELSFSWKLGEKNTHTHTTRNMISKITFSKNLSKFGQTRSSPSTTFVVV